MLTIFQNLKNPEDKKRESNGFLFWGKKKKKKETKPLILYHPSATLRYGKENQRDRSSAGRKKKVSLEEEGGVFT